MTFGDLRLLSSVWVCENCRRAVICHSGEPPFLDRVVVGDGTREWRRCWDPSRSHDTLE